MPSTARMIPCQLLPHGGGCCLAAHHLGNCRAIDAPVEEPLGKRARKTPLRIADCECPPAKAPRVEAPTAPALAPRIEEAPAPPAPIVAPIVEAAEAPIAPIAAEAVNGMAAAEASEASEVSAEDIMEDLAEVVGSPVDAESVMHSEEEDEEDEEEQEEEDEQEEQDEQEDEDEQDEQDEQDEALPVFKLPNGEVVTSGTAVSLAMARDMVLSLECCEGLLSAKEHKKVLAKGKRAVGMKIENWNGWNEKSDTGLFRAAMVPFAQAKFLMKARIEAFLELCPARFTFDTREQKVHDDLFAGVIFRNGMLTMTSTFNACMMQQHGVLPDFIINHSGGPPAVVARIIKR